VNGVWSYSADAHNEFAEGVDYTDLFTVRSVDGTEDAVTVTITGTNDVPIAVAFNDEILTEDSTKVIQTSLAFQDDDLGDYLTYSAQQLVLNSFEAPTPTGPFSLGWEEMTLADVSRALNNNVDLTGGSVERMFKLTLTVDMAGIQDETLSHIDAIEGAELDLGIDWSQFESFSTNGSTTGLFDTKQLASDLVIGANKLTDGAEQLKLLIGSSRTQEPQLTIVDNVDNDLPSSQALLAIYLKPVEDLSGSQIELSNASIAGQDLIGEERIDIDFSQSAYTTPVGQFTGATNALPSWLAFDSVTGELVASPTHEDTLALQPTGGQISIQIEATDTLGQSVHSEPIFITVTQTAEDAPIITGTPNNTTDEESPYSFLPDSRDSSGDELEFIITNKPTWADFDPLTGMLSGTPDNNDVGKTQGIVISVSDGISTVSLDPFDLEVVNVNDYPDITSSISAAQGTVTEDATEMTATGTITANDIDKDDSLIFSIDNPIGTYGSLAITQSVSEADTAVWTYTLDNNKADTDALADGAVITDTITVTVTDSHGEKVTQDVTVTITGANDGPVVDSTLTDVQGSVIENADTTSDTGTIVVSDVDANDHLTFSVGNPTGTYGSLAIAQDGIWTYTLDNSDADTNALIGEEVVNDTITVTVTDNHGALATQDVAVTITGVNDAPVFLSSNVWNVYENENKVGALTATDPEGAPMTFSIIGGEDQALFQVVTVTENDTVTYELQFISTPDFENAGDVGLDNNYAVTVSVSDGEKSQLQDIGINVQDVDEHTGIVIDGPLANARVFVDVDGDSVWDDGEDFTFTDADARFELNTIQSGQVVVTTTEETVDILSGMVVSGLTLKAPTGATVFTPITTLLVELENSGMSAVEAQTSVKNALGLSLPTGTDLTSFNPMAVGINDDHQAKYLNVNAQMVGALKALSSLIENTTDGSLTQQTIFDQGIKTLATKIKEIGSSDSVTQLDLSDAAELEQLGQTLKTEFSHVIVDSATFDSALGHVKMAVSNVNAEIQKISSYADDTAKNLMAVAQTTLAEQSKAFVVSGTEMSLADTANILTHLDTVHQNIKHSPVNLNLTNKVVTSGVEGMSVGLLSVVDIDIGDTHNFSLSGKDKDLFEVVETDGQYLLKLVAGIAANAAVDKGYELNIRVTDQDNYSFTKRFAVHVIENEAPVGLNLDSSLFITENNSGAVVGVLNVQDPDVNDTHSYQLSGTDAQHFEIVDQTLKLKDDVSADFENQNHYDLTISAIDSGNLSIERSFAIQIQNANDPALMTVTDQRIEEGVSTVSGQVTHTDFDANNADNVFQPVTGIVSTQGYGTFTVLGNGAWTYTLDNTHVNINALSPDETLEDQITVTAEDGTTQAVTITIEGSNDAPVITGDITGNVIEDAVQTAVSGQLSGSDAEGDALTYAVNNPTGTYGSLAIVETGVGAGQWTYTINNNDIDTNALGFENNVDSVLSDQPFSLRYELVKASTASIELYGSDFTSEPDAQIIKLTVHADMAGIDGTVFDTKTQAEVSVDSIAGAALSIEGDWSQLQSMVDVTGKVDDFWTIKNSVGGDLFTGATLNENGSTLDLSLSSINTTQAPLLTLVDTNTPVDPRTATDLPTAKDLMTVYLSAGDNFNPLDWSFSGVVSANKGDVEFMQLVTKPMGVPEQVNDIFTVTVTDAHGDSSTEEITVNVTGANDTPEITSSLNLTHPENSLIVTRIEALDVDSAGLTYSLVSGPDQDKFEVIEVIEVIENNSTFYELRFKSAPDFENPVDSGGDNIYELEVSVSDGDLTTTREMNVSVTNVEGGPVFSSPVEKSVSENQTGVMTLSASDDEGDQITFSISGGTDASAFTLTTDGILSFNTAPDYETKNSYSLVVTATESTTQSGTAINNPNTTNQTLTITINDANDPALITVTDQTITEGILAVSGQATHTDLDANNTDNVFQAVTGIESTQGYGTYTVLGNGAWTYTLDNTHVNINALSPDETLEDQISVTAEDGTTQAVTITIEGTNDAPVIAGDITGSVIEDAVQTAVSGQLSGSDAEGDALTYIINDPTGTYGSLAIAQDGIWTYTVDNNNADTEALANGTVVTDTITITVTDNHGALATQDVAVTITGVNDAPVFTSSNTWNVSENENKVGVLTATDAEDGQITYNIVDGEDQEKFQIVTVTVNDTVTYELQFITAPDFENAGDYDLGNDYTVTVLASDGVLAVTQDLTVSVTNVEGGPVFLSPIAKAVYENETSVMTLSASDDEDDQITFSISGGADASAFTLTPEGVLSFNTTPDYETNNGYSLVVTATESATQSGGVISNPNSSDQNITITIADLNERPEMTSPSAFNFSGNNLGVTTLTASDPENDLLVYSLTGVDQDKFEIIEVTENNLTSYELHFTSTPDFENPGDTDGNNQYEVSVIATESTTQSGAVINNPNSSDPQSVTVTVAAENVAPTAINLSSGRVIEASAGAVVGALTVVDLNVNDSHTFELTGTDAGFFEIVENQLKLKGDVSLDYAAQPSNGYAVTVTATDSGDLPIADDFVVKVSGIFDSPVNRPFTLIPEVDAVTRQLTLTLRADLTGITSLDAQQFDYNQQVDIDVDWNQFDWVEPDNKTVDITTLDNYPTYMFNTSKEVAPLSIPIVDLMGMFGTYKPMLDSTTPSKDIATVTLDPSEHVSSVVLTYEGQGEINNGTEYEQTPVSMIVGIDVGILTGTPGDDLIWGSAGIDTLTGGGGNDTFLYNSANKSNDLINNFTVSGGGDEKDSLDLSDLLVGFNAVSSTFSDFLDVTNDGSNTFVKVDEDGNGSGFSDMTLTLEGVITDLDDLKNNEQLIL